MSETILLTGAGGFVGSAVTRRLASRLDAGEVTLVGRGPATRLVALVRPDESLHRLETVTTGGPVEIRRLDLGSERAVRDVVLELRPSAIVHTAVPGEVFACDSATDAAEMVARPLQTLVGALGEVGGKRFLHTSSCWVLPAGDALAEGSSLDPRGSYAMAKAHEDAVLPALAGDAGVEWVTLRLFNLFGRYERASRLIPYLVAQLSNGRLAELSTPSNVRDFSDVDLVSEAFVLALRAETAATNRLFHIGSGIGVTLREMAQIVSEVVGRPDLVRFGARNTPDRSVPVQVADVSAAVEGLGWDPPGDPSLDVRRVTEWWMERIHGDARAHQPEEAVS